MVTNGKSRWHSGGMLLLFIYGYYGQSAISSCHEWGCAFALSLYEWEVERTALDEATSDEAVVRLHFAVVRLDDAISAIAEIIQQKHTIWRPSYLYPIALLQFATNDLSSLKKRRVVVRTAFKPFHERVEIIVTNIFRKQIESLHTRFV